MFYRTVAYLSAHTWAHIPSQNNRRRNQTFFESVTATWDQRQIYFLLVFRICTWPFSTVVSYFMPAFNSSIQFVQSKWLNAYSRALISHTTKKHYTALEKWSDEHDITQLTVEKYWHMFIWSTIKHYKTLQQDRFFHILIFLHFSDNKNKPNKMWKLLMSVKRKAQWFNNKISESTWTFTYLLHGAESFLRS